MNFLVLDELALQCDENVLQTGWSIFQSNMLSNEWMGEYILKKDKLGSQLN